MNFFGHATIALRQSEAPELVLGAMLPDLCSMSGLRITALEEPGLERGVALHHETDHRFHAAPAFRALCESALESLSHQGVQRGCARAVGHVGSELLLDGLLCEDRSARASYRQVLESALARDLAARIRFRDAAGSAVLRSTLARLTRAPIPEGYRDPEFVCERLRAILARRPRLAMQASDAPAVRSWLRTAQAQLQQNLQALLAASGS